ncbi:MAG: NUDIX domain-containing protein, partial [Candidatus Micrarchaeota archaeon]|nr:NUDIX domain-containing protein [Candidatus Micrarchaeota archaeon]
KREIWEEAGIRDYNIVKGFVRKNFHTHKDGTKHWIIHYLATVDHPNIRLSEEHCEFDWRDLDGAKSRIHEHHDDVQKHFASILEEADTALKAKDRPSKD